jgi:anti-anti-sigma factor
MEITTHQHDDTRVVLRLEGRLDLVSARDLRTAVTQVVEGGSVNVVVDLSGVTSVDSSGLGALIGALKTARQAGGELRVAALGEHVLMVMQLTRLVRVLRPYDTAEAALQSL